MSNSFDPFAIIKQQQEENKYRTQILDLREVEEHPKNDFPITKEDVESLAESILKSSGILQFPLVRLLPDGTFQMLAGHKRRKASIMLGETVDEKYFRTMCYVLEDTSDERAELYLIDTNIQSRNMSPKFRAQKVADARKLIQSLIKSGELKTNSIKRAVAEHTGMSESSVILQTRIAEKLSKDLMDLYDQGKITMREAYDYSGLSKNAQKAIYRTFQKELSEDHLRASVSKIIIQDKLKVGETHPSEKEASRRLKQAYSCLIKTVELQKDGITLDRDSLIQLKSLVEELLANDDS